MTKDELYDYMIEQMDYGKLESLLIFALHSSDKMAKAIINLCSEEEINSALALIGCDIRISR